MKTITISDEVYRKLVALKKGRSFSEVIDDLIKANVSHRIEAIIRLSEAGLDEDLEKVVETIREGFRARLNEATT